MGRAGRRCLSTNYEYCVAAKGVYFTRQHNGTTLMDRVVVLAPELSLFVWNVVVKVANRNGTRRGN